ncbi:MAG: hypothetical protein ACR2M4_11895 [Actinomycetota bacterium]
MWHCNGGPTPGVDEELELDEEAEANEAAEDARLAAIKARLALVLIDGDYIVKGINAMAREISKSHQWLSYGLDHHRELGFVQRDYGPPEAMGSSLQNFRNKIIPLMETRVLRDQQVRGRVRGKANKRPQMWHRLPCKPPSDE